MTPASKPRASAPVKPRAPRQPRLPKPKWNVDDVDQWGPEEHQLGATIPEAGNSIFNETGGWRSERPEFDAGKCDGCMLCYFYCPDAAVLVEGGKAVGMDEAHCKGCGICAKECPEHAVTMKIEEKG
jgi:pyruvate ferredoxin oxidoreductase delta subunit